MRSGIWPWSFLGAIIALLLAPTQGYAAGSSSKKTRPVAETIRQAIDRNAQSVQLVTFRDTQWGPVKIVRGSAPTKSSDVQKMPAEKAESPETVTFGEPQPRSVRVMRGESHSATTPEQPRLESRMGIEVVSFTDPQYHPVSILRGWISHNDDTALFGPASVADLDRVAFAVDGIESSHGADLGMWRPEASAAQGPMQVTAAAATDVGGGDRFDLAGNRALGRAYLARMYRRYGNWPDAIAAYNWGPGNVDSWIGNGRVANNFPLEVERYRDRVLRDSGLPKPVL